MKLLAMMAAATAILSAADTLRIFDREWTVPFASDWKVEKEDGTPVLRLVERRGPLPGPRRPFQFALTDTLEYGRVTVELEVKPLDGSLMIVFAYRDAAHFDYLHLAPDRATEQPMHNGIFHVYGGERVRISSERSPAAFPAIGRWYHVKLIHDATAGTVGVTVDDQALPALQAVDMSLGAGRVGVGSFDETGAFKNVTITITTTTTTTPAGSPAH